MNTTYTITDVTTKLARHYTSKSAAMFALGMRYATIIGQRGIDTALPSEIYYFDKEKGNIYVSGSTIPVITLTVN